MFREALDYSTRPPRGGRAVLVGGTLLLVVGVLVGVALLDPALAPAVLLALLPWLLVRGYYVRVVRRTIGREFPTPPGFAGVVALLRDGLASVLITVGYLLPGVAVLAPFLFARLSGSDLVGLVLGEAASPALIGGVNAGAGVLALFAVFAIIGATYALPVAVARYAHTGRLRAAFDLRTVVSGAATEDYVVAWGVSLLLQVLVLPVAFLLQAIVVGFYVQFLVAMGVRYCYGQGVGVALGLDPVGPPVPGADRADLRPAVQPIDDSDVLERRARAATDDGPDGGPSDGGPSGGGPPDEDDPFEYPARDRSEGERT